MKSFRGRLLCVCCVVVDVAQCQRPSAAGKRAGNSRRIYTSLAGWDGPDSATSFFLSLPGVSERLSLFSWFDLPFCNSRRPPPHPFCWPALYYTHVRSGWKILIPWYPESSILHCMSPSSSSSSVHRGKPGEFIVRPVRFAHAANNFLDWPARFSWL
jgi:hypothetical protein